MSLRQNILDQAALMQGPFTLKDVAEKMAHAADGTFRTTFGLLVSAGLIVPTGEVRRLPDSHGRPESLYTTIGKATGSAAKTPGLIAAVKGVLPQMARTFSIKDVAARIGLTARSHYGIGLALKQLQDEGLCHYMVEIEYEALEAHKRGRRPVLWTAQPALVNDQRSYLALITSLRTGD